MYWEDFASVVAEVRIRPLRGLIDVFHEDCHSGSGDRIGSTTGRVDGQLVLPVVATPAGSIFPGSHGDRERCLDAVAQSDQAITQLGSVIESVNLRAQVTEFIYGTRQAVGRAYQAHVVPHDVLDGAHVLGDEGRISNVAAGIVPGGDVPGVHV